MNYAKINKNDIARSAALTVRSALPRMTASWFGSAPKCGNRDQSKMNAARRTCGYIGTQYWNQGRTQEIQERVLHL